MRSASSELSLTIPHAVEDGTSSFNPEPTATACITERRRRWLRVKRANGNRVRYITTEELLRIRQDPSRLPPGWSIDGATNRGRRAA